MIDPLILVPEAAQELPQTMVIQPTTALDSATLPEFQQRLAAALAQATETVIVDLLWVETIDPGAIALLAAEMQHAATLNKSISVQTMNARTRIALNAECDRLREKDHGTWNECYQQELVTFFDRLADSVAQSDTSHKRFN
jgi:anti-anti-sigma regulatory factor